MADLLVIVPTRGRPRSAFDLLDQFGATCKSGTDLLFVVDDDDQDLAEYRKLPAECLQVVQHTNMVGALNEVAVSRTSEYFALGFMGDDHYPRTGGWDAAYLEALGVLGTGIVYGNDLIRGKLLPTQCAMTSDIVDALGFMAPPELTHLFVDNFWRDLGTSAGCLTYLPDVVIEHRHPIAGKASWDASYLRVNSPEMNAADQDAYARYYDERFAEDVERIRRLVAFS